MEKKILLQELAERLAVGGKISKKKADFFVRSFFEVAEEALLRDKFLKIKGFGTFKIISVSDRESVSVNTGERIQISGHAKVTFTPDALLRDLVNRPFAHFETTILNDNTNVSELEDVPEVEPDIQDEDNETDVADECLAKETKEFVEAKPELEAKTETKIETEVEEPAKTEVEVKTTIIETEPKAEVEVEIETITQAEAIGEAEMPSEQSAGAEAVPTEEPAGETPSSQVEDEMQDEVREELCAEECSCSSQCSIKQKLTYSFFTILLMLGSFAAGHYHWFIPCEQCMAPINDSTEVQATQADSLYNDSTDIEKPAMQSASPKAVVSSPDSLTESAPKEQALPSKPQTVPQMGRVNRAPKPVAPVQTSPAMEPVKNTVEVPSTPAPTGNANQESRSAQLVLQDSSSKTAIVPAKTDNSTATPSNP